MSSWGFTNSTIKLEAKIHLVVVDTVSGTHMNLALISMLSVLQIDKPQVTVKR